MLGSDAYSFLRSRIMSVKRGSVSRSGAGQSFTAEGEKNKFRGEGFYELRDVEGLGR